MWVVRNLDRGRFDIGERRRAKERGVKYVERPILGDEDLREGEDDRPACCGGRELREDEPEQSVTR